VTPHCDFDRRALRALTLACTLVACDSGTPRTGEDRGVVASSKSDASTARSTDAPGAAALDAGVADARTLDAGADAPLGNPRSFELSRTSTDEKSCIDLVVGAARERAVLCNDVEWAYWTVTRQVVRVVRAGKKVIVLELPTRVEGFDTGATMLETRLRIAADGMSATVDGVPAKRDAPEPTHGNPIEDCKSAPPTRKDEAQERANYGRPTYGELMRRLCASRGTYRWSGDRFTRSVD
jgi:hypothetical protein